MSDRVIIFDTTLRDGEQSPGATMDLNDKLRVARQLEALGVDVIEAGFPAASDGDFEAVKAIAQADLLIIGGTSMTVWPAAGMIRYFGGDRTVIINRDATAADGDADLIIRKPIGQVLGSLFD